MEKKITQLFLSFLFTLLMLSSTSLTAQCFYNLEMFDSWGDGWNGASLVITVNGTATNYVMNNIDDDGEFVEFDILISNGDTFEIEYISGSYDNEVTYFLYDSQGNEVFSDGPNPAIGAGVFMGTGICPSCPSPLVSSVSLDRVRGDFTDLSWETTTGGVSIVEYGLAGFALGTGTFLNTSNTEASLYNLEENTEYELYLSLDCGMDTSDVLGPFPFKTIWVNDVGVTGVIQPNGSCILGTDSIEILLTNFGQNPQSLIPLQFSVNGIPANVPFPTDGYYTGVLSFDSTTTYVFDTTWDFDQPGATYLIEVWTEFDTDSDILNDTFAFEYKSVDAFPLIEDFETGVLPDDWVADNDVNVGLGHNSLTNVIYDNIYIGDPEMTVATSFYALVNAGDAFTFDYRYADWSAGDVGSVLSGDQLEVQITADCGATYNTIYTVNDANHTPSADFTNIEVDISEYEGESVGFRFVATWASGDYWLDIDNVNVLACPPSLGIFLATTDPTSGGAYDGTATVTDVAQGIGPYTYLWEDGSTGNSISGLGDGMYTVVVTDSLGCMEEVLFTIGNGVSTYDIETLEAVKIFPNPTIGQATLQVSFNESTDVKVQILDIYGKIISEEFHSGILEKNISIASERFEAGMYFVRLETAGKWHLEKLLKL